MPTSRYEAYTLRVEVDSKEEIVGDARACKALGEIAVELVAKEENHLSSASL